MKGIVPGFSGSDHGVEDGQELAHASDDGDLLGFAGENQAIVESADHRVEADGGQCRHVEAASDLSAPAEDGALAAHLAGVAIERGNADEGTDFPAGQAAQFRDVGNQGSDGGRTDAAYASKPLG